MLFCGFGAASTIVTKNYAQLGIERAALPQPRQLLDAVHRGLRRRRRGRAHALRGAAGRRASCPRTTRRSEVAQDYAATYTEATGEPISTFGGHAYDALLLLTSAIERAGGKDPAAVRDALEQTERLVGVDGIFNDVARGPHGPRPRTR